VNHCMRHFEEPVAGVCRTCDRPFCGRCLVFSFGPNKPPYCVGCAITASGVRNNTKIVTSKPVAARGPDRRLERAQRRADKRAAKAPQRAMKRLGDPAPDPEPPRTDNVPVPANLLMPSSRFAPPSPEQPVR